MSYGSSPGGAPQPQQPYGQQAGAYPGQQSTYAAGGTYGTGYGYGAGYGASGYGQPGFSPALPPEVAPLAGADPIQAVRRFFRRYAQFRGYASRSEFWWALAALLAAQLVVTLVVLGLTAGSAAASSDGTPNAAVIAVGWFLYMVIGLGTIVPCIAAAVRRLHDGGFSGLFFLLVLVPGGSIALLVLWCLPSRPERYRPEWG
ncbi:DUF805 domain-containing protein [Actinomyces wuliandei]|uniref:DUF805 domain-containing protein n=1 Tax=Actinomyces wuliandei TaxID=2057743 RepID=UPI000FDA9873|nr:DUF805 domain-containing protein [Actinomyces wuliandei]